MEPIEIKALIELHLKNLKKTIKCRTTSDRVNALNYLKQEALKVSELSKQLAEDYSAQIESLKEVRK